MYRKTLLTAALLTGALAVGAGCSQQEAPVTDETQAAEEETFSDEELPPGDDLEPDEDGFFKAVMAHPDWERHHNERVPEQSTENEYKVEIVSVNGGNACMAMEEGQDMEWYAQEEAYYEDVSVEAEQHLIDAAGEYLCPWAVNPEK